ncbi:MAG: PQQ-dependent sugar dehydrogenase [Gammaproteobacteria bacterium]|nr:PQQ-dependent sugar dehydrogenase [Gammaproteobacteria bacterium]
MIYLIRILLFFAIFILSIFKLEANPIGVIEPITKDFEIPWGLAFISERHLLVTQRNGHLFQLDIESGQRKEIKGLPAIEVKGQGGLLDVRIGPKYAEQGWIYFTYVKLVKGQGRTTLARAKIKRLILEQWQDLLVTESGTHTSRHFGSRIAFDQANHVFFSVGDRGKRPNGQNLMSHAGSILRLNLDGTIPKDNPFVGRSDALPEIYSYGHRNPQGLAFDAKLQRLWAIEHGPRGGDEVNLIVAGHNYGWPMVSFGKEYWGPIAVGNGTVTAGVTAPEKVYTPSIAPSSLLLYSGLGLPSWRGNLLTGALKLTHLNRLIVQGEKITDEHRYLTERKQRIRQIIEDKQGNLIIATDEGEIYRLNLAIP